MCGIAGEVNYNGEKMQNQAYYEEMKAALQSRGPDQNGIYLLSHVALIHTRLSVVDLEKGKQPMVFQQDERQCCIVYNGELYNTEEVRKQLTAMGYSFQGHSDTEVVLKAYVAWGSGCVAKLNGIFAFAVWDANTDRLFIARDRMGVKPFFYTIINKQFIFASEIKALLKHPMVQPRITTDSVAELMLIGPGRTAGYGIFENIEELQAGCCGYFSKEGLQIGQYWSLVDKPHTDTFDQTVECVRYLVSDAIQRQLISDVPIGTFLSGGLDSSIISSIAAEHLRNRGERLQTFSVDYLENSQHFQATKFQPNSDDAYIQMMVDAIGSEHHKITIDTPELVQALYHAVDARDLPGMADVDSSLLLFCKEVKKHITVALSGECADELFGGYPWYRDEEVRMKDGFPWSQSTSFRASFINEEIASKISSQEYVAHRYKATLAATSKLDGLSALESRMKEMMCLNVNWFMQTLLDRKDRMSMYNGLEVRVPFCDYRIAEYLYSVPWEMKDYKGREKGLLREAMVGILPDEVLWRKKSPYPKTHNPNYLKAVSQLLREIINDASSPVLQIVKKSELERLLTLESSVPWYGQLMTIPQTIAYFIQMNYWLEKYGVTIV